MLSRILRSEHAQLKQCVHHGLLTRELLKAHERGWPKPLPKLNSLEAVEQWMYCPHTIDQSLHTRIFDRTRVWMSLRLLHGLDLDEFLSGTRHAYHVVQDLLRDGEWDALEPLLQPDCLEAVESWPPAP